MTEARKTAPNKVFASGLSRLKIRDGAKEDLKAQVEDSWKHNGGKGIILAPGCTIDPRVAPETLQFIRKCVEATAI